MEDQIEKPSLAVSLTLILLYLFAGIPLTIAITYGMTHLGYEFDKLINNLPQITIPVQIGITGSLIFFLIRKYPIYLFSEGWDQKFLQYSKIGLKYAVPLLFLHAISVTVPVIRENLISRYFSMGIVTASRFSSFAYVIFFIWTILGAIFEELFFRGIVVRKLRKFVKGSFPVFISALFFALSHFTFTQIDIGSLSSSFLVGILCGYAYTSTGSCISAIIPHLLNNIICAVFVWTII